MDHPFVVGVFVVCAFLCCLMYWRACRKSRELEVRLSVAEGGHDASRPRTLPKGEGDSRNQSASIMAALDLWIDKQLASESTLVRIQYGALAAAIPFALLFHTTYYPMLLGLYALAVILAIVIGFLLRPVGDVFRVRTTLPLSTPLSSRSVKHDQILIRVEVARLWLLFLPTFAALAFFIVASANGLIWWDSIAYPLVFLAQIIIFNVLSTWVAERSILRDAKACFVDYLSGGRKYLRYSFKDDAGAYCGGTAIRFQIHSREIQGIVLYKTLNPDANKIASAFVFHRFKIIGRGLSEFDQATATAHTDQARVVPETL